MWILATPSVNCKKPSECGFGHSRQELQTFSVLTLPSAALPDAHDHLREALRQIYSNTHGHAIKKSSLGNSQLVGEYPKLPMVYESLQQVGKPENLDTKFKALNCCMESQGAIDKTIVEE